MEQIGENYCASRQKTVRRVTREVRVGDICIGGNRPIVVQSMTTTPTQDVRATVQQAILLAEAGCEVVRITAQNVKAAEALGDIRKEFTHAGFASVPLVADIHFLPKAAMEAAKHVEKVRINPGNYADQKKFKVREYSDREYTEELERLHTAFSPIVLRCKELGRAMRIGTNHGSLSDRILNRYGDTPMGMCESALEFIRIAESHGFRDIILSMKASNPKVMIQAYRLMVARMDAEGMQYPLHLGVTEAGDGDDARIKSSIGIGSLLYDGLGDTIRVSLTEDPVAEIPVAQELARKAMALWQTDSTIHLDPPSERLSERLDPYAYERRKVTALQLGRDLKVGPLEFARVVQACPESILSIDSGQRTNELKGLQSALKEARIEGLLIPFPLPINESPETIRAEVDGLVDCVFWESDWPLTSEMLHKLGAGSRIGDAWCVSIQEPQDIDILKEGIRLYGIIPVLKVTATGLMDFLKAADVHFFASCIFTLDTQQRLPKGVHPLGAYRQIAAILDAAGCTAPIWIRNQPSLQIAATNKGFGQALMDASMLTGALLCDGIGDIISIESVSSARQSTTLAYNILQGARARSTKTEFVACPSCGRTLFDLQSTTREIRAATGHLKGVTIAVMGCIVNGPGEMADADFGYVGGAPGKINLYVGKECVQYHIPSNEAVDALISLIQKHGKWTDPPNDD
jgi:(E)-4-hydroxy-3-methylbut-2-enyl-diphosphate synthase